MTREPLHDGYVGATDDVIRRLDISDGPRVALISGGTVV